MGDQFAFVYKLLGGLVIAFIVVFVIAMWGMDLFRKVLDEIKGDDEFDPDTKPDAEWFHQQRQQEWKTAIKRQVREDRRNSVKDTFDTISHSLAIHQEILEEMYGEIIPPAEEIMKTIVKKRR